MKKRVLGRFCLLLCLLLLLAGCQSRTTPQALVTAMKNAEKPSPAGRLYVLSASPEEEGYVGEALLAALFGEGALPPAFELVEEGALWLSLISPCEFSVFLCRSAADTEAVAQMCLDRLTHLKSIRTEASAQPYLEGASVTVRGRWVVLCVSSDPESALRAFRRAL